MILAGYPDEMDCMLKSNPGLSSRFNRVLHFDDYSPLELARIFAFAVREEPLQAGRRHAGPKLMLGLTELHRGRDRHFGNGRAVRNLFEQAIRRLANRIVNIRELSHEQLMLLEHDDIHFDGLPPDIEARRLRRRPLAIPRHLPRLQTHHQGPRLVPRPESPLQQMQPRVHRRLGRAGAKVNQVSPDMPMSPVPFLAPELFHILRDMARLTNIREWTRRLRWPISLEPIVLVVLAVATAAVWGFIALADEVLEGDTHAFDNWLVGAMRSANDPADPLGPRWMEEMARDATALGGLGWVTAATLIVAGYLILDHKSHMAMLVMVASAGGGIMSLLLKSLFDRPRPDLVPHLSHVSTSSFPSGHAMLAAVVYVTLGSLLAAVISRTALKIYVLAIAVVLAIIVGISRVYLGVHYPTDVLAGWLAGLIWALICWLVARWLQIHGQVEKEPVDTACKTNII